MSRLFISFSGGETSAYMAQWLLANRASDYDEIVCLFANTGEENEATLDFVQRCDEQFGLGVVWVEAKVHHGKRKSSSHTVVDHATAARKGEPFEQVIQKYGIPNQAYPHCTRELKLRPMQSYLKSLGWSKGSYDTAVGIRVDEIDRVSPTHKEHRIVYPLVSEHPKTKPQINYWWLQQPFRLPLRGYEGNCKWCWKKSMRKHLTLLCEHPEWYEFPDRMEQQHGLSGHNVDGTRRSFFRKNMTTTDLRLRAMLTKFEPAHDDAIVFDDDLDTPGGGCSESCEVDWTE